MGESRDAEYSPSVELKTVVFAALFKAELASVDKV